MFKMVLNIFHIPVEQPEVLTGLTYILGFLYKTLNVWSCYFSFLSAYSIRQKRDWNHWRCVIFRTNLSSNTNICQFFCCLQPRSSLTCPCFPEGIQNRLESLRNSWCFILRLLSKFRILINEKSRLRKQMFS